MNTTAHRVFRPKFLIFVGPSYENMRFLDEGEVCEDIEAVVSERIRESMSMDEIQEVMAEILTQYTLDSAEDIVRTDDNMYRELSNSQNIVVLRSEIVRFEVLSGMTIYDESGAIIKTENLLKIYLADGSDFTVNKSGRENPGEQYNFKLLQDLCRDLEPIYQTETNVDANVVRPETKPESEEMDKDQFREKLIKTIEKFYKFNNLKIKMETSLREDLEMDDKSIKKFAIYLKDSLGLEIKSNEISKCKTVGALAKYLFSLSKQIPPA